jgi:glycine/D-amino acid oxidase-like deaminating enzyme
VSIVREMAGRSGVAVSRPVAAALVVAVLIGAPYPGKHDGMTNVLSGRPTSVWMDTAPHTTYPALGASLHVDVCVVGGGILGLMTADLLKRAGRTVAVLEANRVATGVTGYTTAKVTALHGLIYDQVRSRFGDDGARHYAEANRAGLELIAERAPGIDCDFRRRPAYTYALDDTEPLRKEVDAARAAGLPAELVTDVDLPWEVAGAVRLPDQAELHPRRFLLEIADGILGVGSVIAERTRATGVHDGDTCRVETDTGAEVEAGAVVLATHYPTLDRGLFFARLSAERSYAIGLRARGAIPQACTSRRSPPRTRSARPRMTAASC